MRKVKYIYWAGALIMTLITTNSAVAQEAAKQNSPASIELLKAKSLWFNTNNAAGLTLDKMHDYSDLNFQYKIKSGDFKKSHDGEKESTLGVSTEGGLKLSGGYVWGKFSYNNETLRNTLYNTTMINPERGMPFYTVDKNMSDWKRQNYKLEMKVASKPLWDKYIVGIQGEYVTSTGAKQVDPRSVGYFYTITVKPGIAAMFGKHSVGVNMVYQNLVEETRTTNSNGQLSQDVYVVKGLGNFYSAVVGGLQSLGQFVYSGNKIGGDIQYSYGISDINFILSGNYHLRVEDVISSPTKPKKEGTIKEEMMSANLTVTKSCDNFHRLDLSYSVNNSSGIEYVQVLDNTYEVQRWVDVYSSVRSTYNQIDMVAKYDFFRGAAHEYKWKAGLFANYRDNDDLYILPKSKMRVENLFFGINAKTNIPLKLANRLILGADFIYKNNINGYYIYKGADATSPVITQFMTPDMQYSRQDYYKIGGEVSYFTNISRSNKSGMFVKVAADYYKPVEGEGNRMQTTIGLGFTF
ncbi:MAG: hypothetical protein CVU13_04255 [Bacteroidetes bacterium HGW-Bacteroidetes-8]|nr:MAG: hypothetical protein CVU13_04255 [Bacteroidetes bacterium HGW-Bacteroidetes-8]